MLGVRGGEDGFPVQLWRDDNTGRLLILGFNEAGYASVEFDLWDVIDWLQNGPGKELLLANGERAAPVRDHSQ